MADEVEVERYEVCVGSDASDPSLRVVSLPFWSRAAADLERDRLLADARAGHLTLPAKATVFVRARPGLDWEPVPAIDPATIIGALSALSRTVPIYVRTWRDHGEYDMVRVGELPAVWLAHLARLHEQSPTARGRV